MLKGTAKVTESETDRGQVPFIRAKMDLRVVQAVGLPKTYILLTTALLEGASHGVYCLGEVQ